MTKRVKILVVVCVAVILCLALVVTVDIVISNKSATEDIEILLTEDSKVVAEYTYEEFEALSLEQRVEFQDSFGSVEKFDEWLQNAMQKEVIEDVPWEKGGKQPSDYEYEEFDALTPEMKTNFQESFGSVEQYDEWLQHALQEESKEDVPWENGGKQPNEYVYKEFEALTPGMRTIFQESFGSIEQYDEWLQNALEEEVEEKLPWENGGKQPSDYTYAEFEALSPYQREEFQESFGSIEKLDKWLQSASGE